MCPSYQVTHDEEHSTRGRARLLFEMLDGHGDGPIKDGWRSEEVKDALDLCLACKGCKTDCPANVDMATYKAEFLAQHYRHRLRPRADYATGWLPAAATAVARTGTRGSAQRAVRQAAPGPTGDPGRRARGPADPGVRHRDAAAVVGPAGPAPWTPSTARRPAARCCSGPTPSPTTSTRRSAGPPSRCSRAPGWKVEIPTEPLCCGLTWISTGQLGVARRVLRRTLAAAGPSRPATAASWSVSSRAVRRSSVPTCTSSSPTTRTPTGSRTTRSRSPSCSTDHTEGWQPPRAVPAVTAIAQVHCHQHAVLKWDADRELLERAGVDVERLDSGCCGLAGNFGFTAGHGEVSRALAEQTLLPRIRAADADTVVLADGFSCRTQIHDLDSGGREGSAPRRAPRRPAADDRHTPPSRPRRNLMTTTVADRLLERLREWGVEQVFGYPGDGINGIVGAFSRADDQPRFIQARHEEMAAFAGRRLREVQRPSRRLHGHVRARGDPPAQRAVRRQARPRAGGGDRRPDQPHRDGRQLPAGGRPPQPVQGRRQRLRADGDRARAAPQRARPRPPDRHEPTRPDRDHHPERRAGAGVRAAHARVQDGAVEPRDRAGPASWADDEAVRAAAELLNAGSKVAMLVGQGARGAAAELEQVADLLGAGVAKALLGKDVLSDELPFVTGSIGLLGTRPSYEMMEDCDTLLTVGSNFPYTQFMPDLDQARARPDRHRRQHDRDALPLRGQPRRRRASHAAGTDPAAAAQGGPRLARRPREEGRPLVGGDGRRGARRRQARQPDADLQRVQQAGTGRQHDRRRQRLGGQLVRPSGADARRRCAASCPGTLATMGPAVPYAIGAKFAHPDRPAIAFEGDGAMQMNGLAELLTIARYYREWSDPRLVVAVLHNNDLNQVTWELRAMGGTPAFIESQALPDTSYADFATSIGLGALTVTDPEHLEDAWRRRSPPIGRSCSTCTATPTSRPSRRTRRSSR